MNLQFDTARVTPRERAGFWREVVCSVKVGISLRCRPITLPSGAKKIRLL